RRMAPLNERSRDPQAPGSALHSVKFSLEIPGIDSTVAVHEPARLPRPLDDARLVNLVRSWRRETAGRPGPGLRTPSRAGRIGCKARSQGIPFRYSNELRRKGSGMDCGAAVRGVQCKPSTRPGGLSGRTRAIPGNSLTSLRFLSKLTP